jgi:parallel beta-helix repeat protein
MIPEMYNNRIEGNEAELGDGGGIYLRGWDSGPRFSGNIILNNRAGDHGGGIYVVNPQQSGGVGITVLNNLISGNSAGGRTQTGNSGGGIWLFRSYALVQNNTIVGNTGDGPTNTYGAGIVMESGGAPVIEKNVIAFNLKGGGIWCEKGVQPTIRNNLAWQNTGGNGGEDCPLWWQFNGNLVDDPYFCDLAGGDFTVASNSGVMTHPAGPLGAFPIPGCGPVPVFPTTWGQIKARYR